MTETVDNSPNAIKAETVVHHKPQSSYRLYRRLFVEFIRPHLGKSLLSLLCMTIVAATTTASAWMMRPLLDKIFLAKTSTDWLFVVAGGIVLMFAV